jgi:hypothetical protein
MNKDAQVDIRTHEAARAYLKAALQHMMAAGKSVHNFSEFTLEKFGDNFRPYLQHFLCDVHEGRVKIEGLTKMAKTAILGLHVTSQKREDLIRIAAYLRAERRGFVGGSPEEDWLVAQKEVDELLAREVGLVVKGRKVLSTAIATMEKEIHNIENVVASWLEEKQDPLSKKKKISVKKKVAIKKKMSATPKAIATKKGVVKKTTSGKKATKKAMGKK